MMIFDHVMRKYGNEFFVLAGKLVDLKGQGRQAVAIFETAECDLQKAKDRGVYVNIGERLLTAICRIQYAIILAWLALSQR